LSVETTSKTRHIDINEVPRTSTDMHTTLHLIEHQFHKQLQSSKISIGMVNDGFSS